MTLAEKRCKFTIAMMHLLSVCNVRGINVAADMVKRCESCHVGHPRSTHRSGLAVDLLFYDKDWNWIRNPDKDMLHMLHDYWEEYHDGAERIEDDLGHFSFEHNGVR